jgi:hypothetical protein
MPGKVKAALLGAAVGGVIAVVIELLAVGFNDEETFFGSQQSWIILGIAVVAVAWTQMRAYDQKTGIYANRED